MSGFNKDISAKLSYLMYSKSLNVNEPHTNGDSHTVYDQFYKKEGNEYVFREGVNSETQAYLKSNPTVVKELKSYNVVAISGDNSDGYAGMVVSPTNQPQEALVVSRGTETNLLDITQDVGSDVSMGIRNTFGMDSETNQLKSAENLLSTAKQLQPEITEVSTTGHSLGGALAVALAAYIAHNPNYILDETYAYNPPGFATSALKGLSKEEIEIVKSRSYVYSVEGDRISRIFNDHIVPVIIVYSSGDDKHSSSQFVIKDVSSFYTGFINPDGSINVENVALRYNEIIAEENLIISKINDMGIFSNSIDYLISWFSDKGYEAQLENIQAQKEGLAIILKGSTTSFEGEMEFWQEKLDKINPELAEILKLNRCLNPSLLIQEGAYKTEMFMTDLIGGRNNKLILDAIIDSIKDLPTQEDKENIIQSFEDNEYSKLLDKILSTDNVDKDDKLGIVSLQDSINLAHAGIRQTIRRDPLILDLDGDGIETVTADGSIMFDSNADGVKRGTGWVGADDGLLVRDLNKDGNIENGRELFGDATIKQDGSIATDGFDALSDLDSNNDGIFNSLDETFEEIKVWQDINQDAISQNNELKTLSEVGITNINIESIATNTITDGGIISKESTFITDDETTATIGNLDFDQNAAYREFTDSLDTSEFNDMMDISGIGQVRDLQEAATLNTELGSLLHKMNNESYITKLELADNLLIEWSKTGNFSDTQNLETITLEDGTSFTFDISTTTRTNLNKVQVLETFSSSKLIQISIDGEILTITSGNKSRNYTITRGQENILTDEYFTAGWTAHREGWSNITDLNFTSINNGYDNLLSNIKDEVFTQTEYSKVLENLQFEFDIDTNEININFDKINEHLKNISKESPLSSLILTSKLSTLNDSLFIENSWDNTEVFETAINVVGNFKYSDFEISLFNSKNITVNGQKLHINTQGSSESDTLLGDAEDNIIQGGNQSDILYGGHGNDVLKGDNITTSDINHSASRFKEYHDYKGNDTLVGGRGNDTLTGGYGSDTYIFNKGDGTDTITEISLNDYFIKNYRYSSKRSHDIIKFGEDISKDDIKFVIDSNDLNIFFSKDEADKIIIKDFESITLNKIEFANGTQSDIIELIEELGISGTSGNDFLNYRDGVNSYKTGDGDDIVSITSSYKAKNILIDGENGDDYINNIGNNTTIIGGNGDDTIISDGYNTIINSGNGNDSVTVDNNNYNQEYNAHVNTGSGDDNINIGNTITNSVFETESGNDNIKIGWGSKNNIFNAGKGNDSYTLNDALENNTFKYNLGDGFDTISFQYSFMTTLNKTDKILFGEGINQKDLSFQQDNNDMKIIINNDPNQGILIKEFFNENDGYHTTINNFEFADGSNIKTSRWLKDIVKVDENNISQGSDNNETLIANNSNQKLFGEGGDDLLKNNGYGIENLEFNAGSGNDILETGNTNNSIFNGEQGNDEYILNRQTNNNTFIYNLGDGFDTIKAESIYSNFSNRTDKILFGENINQEDLSFIKEDQNMKILINNDATQGILIKNFFNEIDGNYTNIGNFEFADGSIIQSTKWLKNIIVNRWGENNLEGTSNDETLIYGNSYSMGEKKINGQNGDDILIDKGWESSNLEFNGGTGDDILKAGDGTNTSTFIGGKGNDQYLFKDNPYGYNNFIKYNLGDGFDTIVDADKLKTRTTKVIFGKEIYKKDAQFIKQDNDMKIIINNDPTQGILIKNFFDEKYGNATSIESFVFNDGLIKSTDWLKEIVSTNSDNIEGTDNDEIFFTNQNNQILSAGTGNDILIADKYKSDNLEFNAQEGNDIIKTGYGTTNSTFSGNTGNDNYILNEIGQNNIFKYNLNDGFDTIELEKASKVLTNKNSKVLFGEGITQENLIFTEDNNNLKIIVNNDNSQGILIKNFFNKDGSQNIDTINNFEFANGNILEASNIQVGTQLDNNLTGSNANDIIFANEGNDIITAGKGDDIISGGKGMDTYNYSSGDGNDIINAYSEDGTIDTLNLIDVEKDDLSFSKENNDLKIMYEGVEAINEIVVDNYFESQFNQGLIIDTADEFQMNLATMANKMAEIISSVGIDDDFDGGSVDNIDQTTTNINSSYFNDFWNFKNS